MPWRWDQGRLQYFQLGVVKRVAGVLAAFDGQIIGGSEALGDLLREPLTEATHLPFLPNDERYQVWRNYGRVLALQFLAAKLENRLYATEVCHALAQDLMSEDQYMQFVVRRFSYPSPCFEGYDETAPTTFPFAAIIKFLAARTSTGMNSATVADISSFLVGNGVTGQENLAFYRTLVPSNFIAAGDEERQLRELMIFLSQAPFLSWNYPSLYIDVMSIPAPWESFLFAYATPDPRPRKAVKEEEILNAARIDGILLPELPVTEQYPEQSGFLEGNRRAATHFLIERSANVRQMYLRSAANPSLCDMCRMDTQVAYPWSRSLIEIHHLLPLSPLLRFEPRHTSLADLVGICPTCHRATHQFYKSWLTEMSIADFRSEQEAKEVYTRAKERLVGFDWRPNA